jgi:hypothetical protein
MIKNGQGNERTGNVKEKREKRRKGVRKEEEVNEER